MEKKVYELRFTDILTGMNAIQRYDLDESGSMLDRFDRLKASNADPKIFLVIEKPMKVAELDPWVAFMEMTQ